MQNTDTSRPSLVKVTRIQKSCFHTCTRHPASGVAETRAAEEVPRSKTTRPPETEYPFTFPDPPCAPPSWTGRCCPGGGADFERAGAEGEAGADEAPGADGDGGAGDEGEGDADGPGDGGGSVPRVEEDSGRVASGTASGGS
ncbi:hypothetical protein GCM10010302_22650 [Streptomyces polychromogenes]|uniref:Uncharacterized protein n=1 Tax=Streptomyces polychromogenes TaxID=67342 RepID=A0ABN0VBU9_9ACTN